VQWWLSIPYILNYLASANNRPINENGSAEMIGCVKKSAKYIEAEKSNGI
jgi:hypothetical protein